VDLQNNLRRADRGSTNASDPTAFERACTLVVWILGALAILTAVLPFIGGGERLTGTLAFKQDVYVAPLQLVILLLVRRWAVGEAKAGLWPSRPTLWIAGSIALIVLVGWAGHYVVFDGYDLSRDEQMASFDTAIFRHGQLFAPIPAAWRPIADALNLTFILPIGAREFWVSAYLPVHSAWRAALSYVADPALASPLMAALGGYCIWRISRLLWPASAATQLVCVLLYAGSSQVLVTAMTAYSMSMHLALNMLWLWLFLLDRRQTHAAAMIVGWFAIGIHQPVFHALFVLPFLFLLLGQKRWKLLAAYCLAYALIGAFWLSWPIWISSHGTAAALSINGTGGIDFVKRLSTVLASSSYNAWWIMAANLLRFVCWQHPLLVPLAILGIWANFRQQPLCRALAISFVLPILLTSVLLPWQGYGWGYRYVHPVLGCLILLGGYGWQTLETQRVDLRQVMVRTSAFATFIIFPIYAATAHRIASPFVQLHREMIAIPADILIVDTGAAPYADDLVLNRPDLSNRPKMLLAASLKPQDLETVCSLGSIAFVPGPRLAQVSQMFGDKPPSAPTPEMAALMMQARAARCRVVPSAIPSERN
jgi:hypothetical protein